VVEGPAHPHVFGAFIGTETNSFSGLPTTLESFAQFGFSTSETPLDPKKLLDAPLAAARDFFEQRGGRFSHSLRVFAQPGAPTDDAAYAILKTKLLGDLQAAMPVDIVFLGLHGAMMAENEVDCEGDLLAAVRALVGPKAVIGAFLDPHAHLTARMVDSADALNFAKEYPHTDLNDRAADMARLCWRIWAGDVVPRTAVADARLIRMWPTQVEPVKGFVARMIEAEASGRALSVSLVHGFPWGDSPDMGSKVVVITDEDEDAGAALAGELAEALWAIRDTVDVTFLDVDAAYDAALAAPPGPAVIGDVADNPGGGAAQDSTFLLERALVRCLTDIAFAAITDSLAVEAAHRAGCGATLDLAIGGRHGPASGTPVVARWTVEALSDDLRQRSFSDGAEVSLGRAAWLRTGGIDVIVNDERNQIFSTDAFTNIGIDPTSRRILVVKSSNHFYASFSRIASTILHCTTPGALNMDFASLPYRHLRRPVWPIDPRVTGPEITFA
jgi:microcystin degradation protein MlrC